MFSYLPLIWHTGLTLLSALLFIPFAILFFECICAVLPDRKRNCLVLSKRPAVVVLVPAYNEAHMIASTLHSLQAQLQDWDELIAIADNCTDNTAEIARSLGVTVIERNDPDRTRRGKGYALDFGLRYLASHPPAIVVTVDADCTMTPGTLD